MVASDQTAAQHIPIWKVALWVAAVGWLKGGAEAKGGSKVMQQGEVGSGLEPTRPPAPQPSSYDYDEEMSRTLEVAQEVVSSMAAICR